MPRDLVLGIVFCGAILWLTFFGTAAAVEVATLAAAVVALIWFASVSPDRLVDARRRPHLMVFGLSSLGAAVVLVAAPILGTGTLFVTGLIAVIGVIVGVGRAIRFGITLGSRET